jgi:putative addiction module killer protein
VFEILHYLTPGGIDVFASWLNELVDTTAVARIIARLDRVESGDFGNCKPVGNGVRELRIDYGPGYRVYYTKVGKRIVLILCGGDKRRQSADIRRAIDLCKDYHKRQP